VSSAMPPARTHLGIRRNDRARFSGVHVNALTAIMQRLGISALV
jgi:hypothetical protein